MQKSIVFITLANWISQAIWQFKIATGKNFTFKENSLEFIVVTDYQHKNRAFVYYSRGDNLISLLL